MEPASTVIFWLRVPDSQNHGELLIELKYAESKEIMDYAAYLPKTLEPNEEKDYMWIGWDGMEWETISTQVRV